MSTYWWEKLIPKPPEEPEIPEERTEDPKWWPKAEEWGIVSKGPVPIDPRTGPDPVVEEYREVIHEAIRGFEPDITDEKAHEALLAARKAYQKEKKLGQYEEAIVPATWKGKREWYLAHPEIGVDAFTKEGREFKSWIKEGLAPKGGKYRITAEYQALQALVKGEKEAKVEKEFLAALPLEEQKVRMEGQATLKGIEKEATPMAEEQVNTYYEWVKSGKSGDPPEIWMLSDSQKEKIEKTFREYGSEVYVTYRKSNLKNLIKDVTEKATTKVGQERYFDIQAEEYLKYYEEYLRSRSDDQYRDWLKSHYPELATKISPRFWQALPASHKETALELSKLVERAVGLGAYTRERLPRYEVGTAEVLAREKWEEAVRMLEPMTKAEMAEQGKYMLLPAIAHIPANVRETIATSGKEIRPWLEAVATGLKFIGREIIEPIYRNTVILWSGVVNTARLLLTKDEAEWTPIEKTFMEAARKDGEKTQAMHEPMMHFASAPSKEYWEAYDALPEKDKLIGEMTAPYWWVIPAAGTARAGLIAPAARGGVIGLTARAARIALAPLAAVEWGLGKVLSVAVYPLKRLAAKIITGRQIKELRGIVGQLDDQAKAAIKAIRQKQMAGQKLSAEEQQIANAFKGKWDEVLGAAKVKAKKIDVSDTPKSPLAKIKEMWEAPEVAMPPTFKEAASHTRLRFEELITDKFAGINKMSARARKHYRKLFDGDELPVTIDAELQSSLLAGAPEAGRQRAIGAYQQMRTTLGKGIDEGYVDTYLMLRHGVDVVRMKGTERLGLGPIKGAKEVEEALSQMVKELGVERFHRVEAAAGVLRDFYKITLQRKVDSGLVSKELAELLSKQYPWYNPVKYIEHVVQRLEKGGRILSVSRNDIRQLSEIGLASARERPLNTLARMAVNAEMLIARNDTARAIIKTAEFDSQLANIIKKVAAGKLKPGTRIISFMENGKRVTYKVPQWLEREAKYLSSVSYGPLESLGKAILWPSRFGMTTANLAFFIPNFAIDSMTAMITKGVYPHNITIALVRNLRSIIKTDKVMRQMLEAKGGMSGFWGKSPEQIAREVAKSGQLVLSPKWDIKRILHLPFEVIERLGHAVEMTPRLAVFSKELARGKPLEAAALAARRSTIDFSRGGTAIRQANNFYLYINAGVQGAMIPFRALRDNPRSRLWMAGYLGGIVGNYAWNRQFPEYEDVPDYAKYGSLVWMLPSEEYNRFGNKVPHYACVIPNLREFSLFSAPIIYALRQLDDKDAGSLNQFLDNWVPAINPVSQILGTSAGGHWFEPKIPTPLGQALVDLSRNWDSFRQRDIVSEELMLKPIAEQYDSYTSLTAKKLGTIFNISPKKIDYFIYNIFGGLGKQFVEISDSILRRITPVTVDPRIQGIVEQLKQLQETTAPSKIAIRRKDFLLALSKEDREKVLELERAPEPKIPVLSAIMNRIYRKWGSQIYQTARNRAREYLGNTPDLEEADIELQASVIAAIEAFKGGEITASDMTDQIAYARAVQSGRTAESWRMRQIAGGIAGADVQEFLPPEYRWGPEQEALNSYWERWSELIEKAGGKLSDERWSEIYKELDYFLSTLKPELRRYIEEHERDWIKDLPPEIAEVLERRYNDLEIISDSGYWDMPSPLKRTFRENPINAEIDALMVIWGYRSKPSSPESAALVGELIEQYGLTWDSIYGDDLDTSLKQYRFDMSIHAVYTMIETYDAIPTEDEIDKKRRAKMVDDNPTMEAVFCFIGKQSSFPSSMEVWDKFESLLNLNDYSLEQFYGKETAEIIDELKVYSTLEANEFSLSEVREAFRISHAAFEAWGQKNKNWAPINQRDWSIKKKKRIRAIREERGW